VRRERSTSREAADDATPAQAVCFVVFAVNRGGGAILLRIACTLGGSRRALTYASRTSGGKHGRNGAPRRERVVDDGLCGHREDALRKRLH
jgi:hypothetical protein